MAACTRSRAPGSNDLRTGTAVQGRSALGRRPCHQDHGRHQVAAAVAPHNGPEPRHVRGARPIRGVPLGFGPGGAPGSRVGGLSRPFVLGSTLLAYFLSLMRRELLSVRVDRIAGAETGPHRIRAGPAVEQPCGRPHTATHQERSLGVSSPGAKRRGARTSEGGSAPVNAGSYRRFGGVTSSSFRPDNVVTFTKFGTQTGDGFSICVRRLNGAARTRREAAG